MFKHKYIKDNNFILLFFGNLVSGVGSRIWGFGISLFLLDLTGKATVTATYLSIWSFLLFFLGPIAATFTDRWRKKAKVMYLTDFGRGIIYIAVALVTAFLLTLANNQTYILITIYTALVLIAAQTAFFAPAVSALIPQIVDKEELVSASSIMQITRSLQNIAGLLFGALLYLKFGIVVLMLLNGISFIFSGISEIFIRFKVAKNQDRLNEIKSVSLMDGATESKKTIGMVLNNIYADIKDALSYIFHDSKPVFMVMMIILVSSTLSGPWFNIGVPYMIKQYFTYDGVIEPEYLLALSQLFESIGVILVSFVVSAIASKFKIFQLFRIGGLLFVALGLLYYMIIRSFDSRLITINMFIILFIGTNFIAGSVNATVNAPLEASIQKYVDPNKIGKVMMLIDSFGGILYPITALFAGFMIDNYSMYYPMFMMIGAMLIITIIAFRSKELKKLV